VAGLLLREGETRGNKAADPLAALGDRCAGLLATAHTTPNSYLIPPHPRFHSFSMACLCSKGSMVGGAELPADLVFSTPFMAGGAVATYDVTAADLADTVRELLEEASTASRIVDEMGISIRKDCGLCMVPVGAKL